MLYSKTDLFSLIFGVIFIIVGLVYVTGLAVPSLDKRIYGKISPRNFTDLLQRRKAVLCVILLAGYFIFFGLFYLLQLFVNVACTIQDELRKYSFLSLMLSMICITCFSIIQNRIIRSTNYEHKDAKVTRIPAIFGILLSFGICASLFIAFNHFINRPFERLERIQMVSATEGWAIGNESFNGIMYHYTQGQWRKVAIPNTHLLTDISMISSNEGWAVSDGSTMLHFVNGSWTSVPSPVRELTAISMVSSDDGWAVGNQGNILHYSRGSWIQVSGPTKTSLASVSMVSATEGWAVGSSYSSDTAKGLILHYQNGIWKEVPISVDAPLTRIRMTSATSGWAIGGNRLHIPTSVTLRYQNNQWSPIDNPATIPLNDIVAVSPTEAWAVGGDYFRVPLTCTESYHTVEMHILLHYINGVWKQVSTPTDEALQGISMLTPDDGWIVGWNTFLHYNSGKWEEVQPVKD